jgi:hypothetical protein
VILRDSVIMVLPGLVLRVGPSNLFTVSDLSGPTLGVVETISYLSYI